MLCSVNCVCSLLSCNVTGYCENESVCIVHWNLNNILSYVDISDENPGPPRCDDVIRPANNSMFYFCWMGPNDMSVGWLKGYRVFLSVGDNPREILSLLITFQNDTWRTASTKVKKSSSVCMLCSYKTSGSYMANAYVWSLPTIAENDATACSVSMELNSQDSDKISSTNGTMTSHRKSGYFAVVSVSILVVGSGTLGVIAFIITITKKRKPDSSSGFTSYSKEDEFQLRKRNEFEEDLISDMTSGSNDDLISAVTLGSGNLPAPISECVSEKKNTLKSGVQELLVLSENRKEQILYVKSCSRHDCRLSDTSF
uniref:Ig-like domain-containing protein n=1 Tax=Magallana gigas TaxID=29159 RepID=A0A8W8MTL0_MAGGI